MRTTTSNPIARLLAPIGKSTLALFGAAAIGTAFAGDVAWKGTTGTFSTGANWSTEAYPTSSDTAQFMGASAGSTVTFDGTYAVGYIWVGEVTNPALYIDDNGTATPVVFTASDPSYGMTTAGRFCCADGANQRGALTVNSGTYTTTAGGYWGWGDNVKFVANFNGGTVNINGSPDGSSNGLYMMYGNGVANEINIAGGKLAVENDVVIGTGADATSSTTINISNGGELSCGTASTAKWFKMPADGTGKVTVNLNANGTLALWHIRHVSAGKCAVNFNGGTLKVLGDIGYGLLGYDNNTDASTMSFTLGANGGTIDTDFNTSLNNPVSGTGGLTKKGSGTLTFSAMPTFTGAITVEAGAGSVILPSGATVAAGADTRTRTTSAGVEYYYFSGSTYSSSTLFTAGDDATITLSGDAVLDVDDTKTIGKLTVTGSGVLSIAGSGAVTASSLQIDSGVTVQLVSATTLATGPLQTSLVTGSGTIVYDAVPDGTASDLKPDEAGYTASTWTGTVWIQNCIYRTATGSLWTDPAAYGNSGSKVKFTNARIYLKAGVVCDAEIVLSNIDSTGASKTFGLMLTDGNGGQVNKFAKLSGDGTFSISGSGGATEIISIRDIVDFSGVFNLPSRIVVIGDQDGTIAQQYVGFANTGAIVIPEGVSVSVPSDKTWVLGHGFVGAGTLKYTYPWQVGTSSLSNGDYWTGTVELAACVNDTNTGVVVYPQRMGNANSTVVFKGLGPKDGNTSDYASYWIDTRTIDTNVRLDGDVTLYGNGYSGEGNPTTIKTLSGEGNFTLLTALSAVTYYDVTLDNYTGTLAAKSGQDCIRVTVPLSGVAPAAGTKLVSVSSEENMGNVQLAALTVDGAAQSVAAAVQNGDDGYGLYVTLVQRDVYWIGGASGNWSDTTAWALADGTPLNSYPQDGTQNAGDNVVFTNVAVVAIDVRPVITKMTLNADVTISTADAFQASTYAGKKYLFVETIEGTGTLTMSNAVIAGHNSSRPFKIYTPVCIAKGTINSFGCSNYANYLYGDLSGSGYVEVRNGNGGGLNLYGDNSAFSGEFDSSETTRCISTFYYGNATSSKAIWKLRGTDQTINSVAFVNDSGTYYFGALLDGTLLQSVYRTPTLEVGARDDVPSRADLRGRGVDSKKNEYYFHITKVGTNVFTVVNGNSDYQNNIGNVRIKGGILELPGVPKFASYITFDGAGATLRPTAEDLDFSGLVKNSATPICIDDNGADATWATALASSNIGGLTKKGTGTLTLTAVPQYGGQTVVEAGELVVPVGTMLESLAGNGKLVVDMTGASESGILFSLGNKAAGATVEVRNAPEGYKTLNTANGVVYYVGNPNTYVWTVSEGAGNWSEVSNWSVGGGTPAVPPTAIDTVQFADGASVVIDAAATALTIEGSGSLTITADYDLSVAADIAVGGVLTKWGMSTVSVNGAIEASSVAVGTGAMTTYSGSEPTALTLDSGSTSAYGIDDAASALGYGAKYSVVRPGTLVLSGHGQITAAGDQIVDVPTAADTNSFTGFMSGSMSLNKTGAGTLALFGNNTFTGDFAIEEGVVKLNTPLDLGDVRSDFDASDESWFSYDGNGVLRWRDASRPNADGAFIWNGGVNPAFVEGDQSIFNGRKVLYSDQFKMVEADINSFVNVKPKTSFFVMQNREGQSRTSNGYQTMAGDDRNGQWYISYRNYGYMVHDYNTWYSHGFWANGILGDTATTATYGANGGVDFGLNPAVVTVVCGDGHCWLRGTNSSRAYIGGSGKQAWAEYLTYTREFSFDEKAAVEQYLMAKWGINNMEYTVLPKTAAVTMAPGTTLDMGGLTQTVASFAGAGTVANGSLKTTGDLVATGNLTIQAVAGQTYTLSTGRSDVVTFTGAATGYFVQPQDGSGAASRFAVPNGLTVGFDRDGDFDVTIINAPTKWTLKAYDGAEVTTYRIGSYPFRLYLR